MSLYESFLLLNMFRMLLHSQELVTVCRCIVLFRFVLVRFGWSGVVSECRLVHAVHVLLLNMFRMLLHSSSGAADCM